jgi:hypothetical protein
MEFMVLFLSFHGSLVPSAVRLVESTQSELASFPVRCCSRHVHSLQQNVLLHGSTAMNSIQS